MPHILSIQNTTRSECLTKCHFQSIFANTHLDIQGTPWISLPKNTRDATAYCGCGDGSTAACKSSACAMFSPQTSFADETRFFRPCSSFHFFAAWECAPTTSATSDLSW